MRSDDDALEAAAKEVVVLVATFAGAGVLVFGGLLFFLGGLRGFAVGQDETCRELLHHDDAKYVGMPAVCEVPNAE